MRNTFNDSDPGANGQRRGPQGNNVNRPGAGGKSGYSSNPNLLNSNNPNSNNGKNPSSKRGGRVGGHANQG